MAFGPLADNVNERLRKGLEVVVVGTFTDDSYESPDGGRKRQLVLEAQAIAASLRFGVAAV